MVPFHPAHSVRAHRPWRFRPQVWELESRVVPGFLAPVNYPVEGGPSAVVVGDFNDDGFPDLAVANDGSNTVSVLLGNGDGSFQPAVNYAAGSVPYSVAVGDFNGDGIPDLAVADQGGGVTVLLGNGDGSFAAARTFAAGSVPYSVAVGDFNGDGILDLAVANLQSNSVSVLLGNGDGSFQLAVNYAVGSSPESMAVGDFNGDRIPDLAVVNAGEDFPGPPGSVSVLLGNGDGSFQAAIDSEAGYGPNSLAVGDFNGDGIPDLGVAAYGNSSIGYFDQSIRVLMGHGDGSFDRYYSTYYVSRFELPSSVVAGDFNLDGVLDLAFATRDRYVGVLLGNGDGSFQDSVTYRASRGYTDSAAVADFNGDGWPDVATGSSTYGVVSIVLNDGNWDGGSPGLPAAPDRPRLTPGVAPDWALPPAAILPSDLGATGGLPSPFAVLPAPGETTPGQPSVPASPPLAPPRVQDLGDQVLPTPAPAAETVAGPITGTFAGLDEGAVFAQDGLLFQITYQGGPNGDSVVLTRAG
jgi:hypothetical protein